MKINPGDLVTFNSTSSGVIEAQVIILHHLVTSSSWEDILVLIPSHVSQTNFLFTKEIHLSWVRPISVIDTVSNIENYYSELVVWISIRQIISVPPPISNKSISTKNDFCTCKSCQDNICMAGPNQSDGSFIWFSCRNNPIRIF